MWFQIIYQENIIDQRASPIWGGQATNMVSGISIKDVPNDFTVKYGIFISSNASRNENYGKYVNKTYSWYVTVNAE